MNINICRICLGRELLMSIFKKRGLFTISSKIMSLARVHISLDDNLPNTICFKCVKKLDECIEFIENCESSDTNLRALLAKQKDENNLLLSDKVDVEDYKCTFECDDENFSPNSEIDKDILIIDESLNSTCSQIVNDALVTNNTKNLRQEKEKTVRKQQCFTCGKVMSSRFRLKTHLRTHTGERPFSCSHCGKKFSLAQNLKVHIRVHTGEKPLLCSICGESFAQSAGLTAHRRKHTGELPYQCLLCPRSFRTVGHLQYHTRRHTGEKNFECETCSRAFITRSDLKQHLQTHTKDRPHVCCVCGLRLTRASHLKRHLQLTHNVQQPFACSQCSLKFTKKVDLNAHMKTHEIEDSDWSNVYSTGTGPSSQRGKGATSSRAPQET